MSCWCRSTGVSCELEQDKQVVTFRKVRREEMKRLFIFVRFITTASLVLLCCFAVFAQEEQSTNMGGNMKSSQSGLTGAGAGGSGTTAAKPGRADGLGNPLLGGERRPLYRLRTSDVVDITFTVSPEFNQSLTVQPDGYVALKDAGMVTAEGLTLPEFIEAVRQAYRGYLHDPQVAAALKNFEHPYFTVGGEVGRPGKYELRSDTTVSEAVQIAGGLTSQSKHSQVVLFRRVNDDLVETRLLNLKKMLKENGLREDAHLRPGDLVFVPQNTISKIARFLSKPSASMYVSPTQF
jgi:polysaccharide biosynthesis/export protein